MMLAEHPRHDRKTASHNVQEKNHSYERGYNLLDIGGDVQRADGDFEVFVILKHFHDLEQGKKSVQTREFGQFQESDRDETVTVLLIGNENDQRDWNASDQVDKEPTLDIGDRDFLLVQDHFTIDVLLNEKEIQYDVNKEDYIREKVNELHEVPNIMLIYKRQADWKDNGRVDGKDEDQEIPEQLEKRIWRYHVAWDALFHINVVDFEVELLRRLLLVRLIRLRFLRLSALA